MAWKMWHGKRETERSDQKQEIAMGNLRCLLGANSQWPTGVSEAQVKLVKMAAKTA